MTASAIRSATSERPRWRKTLAATRPADAIRPSSPSPRTASNAICSRRTASADIRGLRLRRDGGRLRLRRLDRRGLDRRFASREAGRKPIRRRVGPAGKFAALLYRIEPLNDLVKTGQAVADEASGDRAIALANHRQDILGGVHRAPHRCEVDDAGAAFERVKRTERPIQARAVCQARAPTPEGRP